MSHWYTFRCYLKGIDFFNERENEIFRKRMTVAMARISSDIKKEIRIANVIASKGVVGEIGHEEAVVGPYDVEKTEKGKG